MSPRWLHFFSGFLQNGNPRSKKGEQPKICITRGKQTRTNHKRENQMLDKIFTTETPVPKRWAVATLRPGLEFRLFEMISVRYHGKHSRGILQKDRRRFDKGNEAPNLSVSFTHWWGNLWTAQQRISSGWIWTQRPLRHYCSETPRSYKTYVSVRARPPTGEGTSVRRRNIRYYCNEEGKKGWIRSYYLKSSVTGTHFIKVYAHLLKSFLVHGRTW